MLSRLRNEGSLPHAMLLKEEKGQHEPKTFWAKSSLIFLSLLFFGKKQGKPPPKKTRIFYLCWTPKIPGKEREKRSKTQGNSLQRKEIQKSKERKIRASLGRPDLSAPKIARFLRLRLRISTASTPNMTGRGLHIRTEVIPHGSCKSKNPFASRPTEISKLELVASSSARLNRETLRT